MKEKFFLRIPTNTLFFFMHPYERLTNIRVDEHAEIILFDHLHTSHQLRSNYMLKEKERTSVFMNHFIVIIKSK